MKRRFDYAGKSYKVRKERGTRLSHKQTDKLLRTLLDTPDATFSASGDTIVVVCDGTAYIATLRERIDLEDGK